MKKLTEDQVNAIRMWAKNAKEESEKLTVVLNGIKKQMCKEKCTNEVSKVIDSNWKEFVEMFKLQMPHVVWNGSKAPVVCDWVEAKEDKQLKKAFRQYRYFGEEIITPMHIVEKDGKQVEEPLAIGSIVRDVEKTAKETITLKSGWEIEVVSRNADGEIIKTEQATKLVPREKNIWGYTDTVIDAFCAAADCLMEQQEQESK